MNYVFVSQLDSNTATLSNSKNTLDKPYNLYNILVKWVYSL